jgi:RING finger protein 170
MRYLFSETFAQNGLSFLNKIRVFLLTVMNVLYLVSPIDILPEAVFGIIGYFDDMVFVFTTLMYLSSVYRDIIANRANMNS